MDSQLSTFQRISWAPICQVIFLSIGTLISFLVAYGRGDVSHYLPFISETGAIVPEMGIFSLTLIIGSVTGSIVVLYQNLVMRYLLAGANQRLKNINNISTVIGLISMFGLAGVSAFPMSTVLSVHMLFAAIHFVFALMYVVLQTFMNHYVPNASVLVNRFRAFLCILLMIFLLVLVILFPLSYFKWNKVNKHRPANKTPEDPVFGLMFSSAFFEWIMYMTLLTFLFSLFFEFRKFHLAIGVVAKPTKTDQENSN